MAGVTYNGQSNNLTGEGSPNPEKLTLPYLDKVDPNTRAALLKIQQFINNLVSPAGGGYASLTGPGQTTTPGKLTQAGDFTVNTTQAGGIALNSTSITAGGVTIFTFQGVSITGRAAVQVISSNSITLQAGAFGISNGVINILTGASGGGTITLSPGPGGNIQFYGTGGGGPQATVSGSRGGNAALASLLTALAATGLVVDGTSP